MMCNLGSAATQSVDILGQLCAGYRAFDLRFKKSTVDNWIGISDGGDLAH